MHQLKEKSDAVLPESSIMRKSSSVGKLTQDEENKGLTMGNFQTSHPLSIGKLIKEQQSENDMTNSHSLEISGLSGGIKSANVNKNIMNKPENSSSPGGQSENSSPLLKPKAEQTSSVFANNQEALSRLAQQDDSDSKSQKSVNSTNSSQIKLGIMCMEKKLASRPMKEILMHLSKTKEISILKFNDKMLFEEPIENWHKVDVLIGFYSNGFPLAKAITYVEKYKPKMINDLTVQNILWDRVKIMEKLKKCNVPCAKSFVVYRGDLKDPAKRNLNQEAIENWYTATKDKGEEHIKNAKQLEEQTDQQSHHKRHSSNLSQSQSEVENLQKSESNQSPSLLNKNSEESKEQQLGGCCEEDEDLLFEDKDAGIKEYDDCIMIRGERLKKPFIEKPICAEDHEIIIHYSTNDSAGSGYSVLFRKTQDACSQFFPSAGKSTIRTEGSYLYEEFLPTDGFDIKVYTVGEDYAHAEARRCPSIDGIVQRDPHTKKEIRYPVNLTSEEKEYARLISKEFKQGICGFDLLRSNGVSYVCDVNGFSFVKTSTKYYEDCATQIKRIIFGMMNHTSLYKNVLNDSASSKSLSKRPFRPVEESKTQKQNKSPWELRSVVAVFRHGDRTPKQKMKMKTSDPDFLKLFGTKVKEIKLKKPKELQQVLLIAQEKIKTMLMRPDISEQNVKQEQEVLEKMVQLKYILERDKFEGFNRKVQLKPLKDEEVIDPKTGNKVRKVTQALFILKFGGELTHAGVNQALHFGEIFRKCMYVDEGSQQDGKGLLRLHSTYRHDMKCFTSDEGRVSKTAAAFCKGLLDLEGALAPILAIMVRNDKASKKMLDDSSQAKDNLEDIKGRLYDFMHYKGDDMVAEFVRRFKEQPPQILVETFDNIKCPYKMLQEISELMEAIIEQILRLLRTNGMYGLITDTYRMVPQEFDKIFHTKMQKSLSFNAGIKEVRPNDLTKTSESDEQSSSLLKSGSLDDNELDRELQHRRQYLELISKSLSERSQPNKKPTKRRPSSGLSKSKSGKKRKFDPINNNNLLEEVDDEVQSNTSSKKTPEDQVSLSKKQSYVDPGVSVGVDIKGQITVCDGEPLYLQLKRWMKIQNDYNKEDGRFDVSKISEICDNIKFDNLHIPQLLRDKAEPEEKEARLRLMVLSQQLCRVIVPMEYGITTPEKVEVGLKIIAPLLQKINRDILWWRDRDTGSKFQSYASEKQEQDKNEHEWDKSGLDESAIRERVKSSWRHIRTRLYFTSASHMYTLLNTLKLGVGSILIDESDLEIRKKLDAILRLDFMSGFVFRLFENLNVQEDDPARFKLEIMVNRGAALNKKMVIEAENHTILINEKNYIDINKQLNLAQVDEFFTDLLHMHEQTTVQSTKVKTEKAEETENSEIKQEQGLLQSNSIMKQNYSEVFEHSSLCEPSPLLIKKQSSGQKQVEVFLKKNDD